MIAADMAGTAAGSVDTAVVEVDTDAVALGLAVLNATAEIAAVTAAAPGPAVQSTGMRHSTGSDPRHRRCLTARETHYRRILQAQAPASAHSAYHSGSCRQKMNAYP